jgi:outer membrane lipoprotein SlyB
VAAQHAAMRLALITSVLFLAAAVPAAAGPYAPQEYDFSEMPALDAQAFGVVESVRELSIRPGAQQLVVRLDDGRELIVTQNGTQHFEPGERVRLSIISPNLRKEIKP